VQKRFVTPNRAFFVNWANTHNVPLATHDDTTAEHVEEAIWERATIVEFPTTLEAARRAKLRNIATGAAASADSNNSSSAISGSGSSSSSMSSINNPCAPLLTVAGAPNLCRGGSHSGVLCCVVVLL
jgi:alpha-D-ribose 1-methylphosphonate 5-triphosphate diphosphatase